MTASDELTALETTYAAWIAAGCPQSYTTPTGQTVTRASAEWMSSRIDRLRTEVGRGTSSGFSVASFSGG